MISCAVDRAKALHARGERPDPGHDQPVRVHRRPSVGGQLDLGTGPLRARADGRAGGCPSP